MSTTVEAIYEDGKLVLHQPLPLPDKARVRVTIETERTNMSDADRAAWLKLSEESLIRAWDNPEDDVFNELLLGAFTPHLTSPCT
jgi:predicted DNA-binding antitoxin AbrB/MazE fold protein